MGIKLTKEEAIRNIAMKLVTGVDDISVAKAIKEAQYIAGGKSENATQITNPDMTRHKGNTHSVGEVDKPNSTNSAENGADFSKLGKPEAGTKSPLGEDKCRYTSKRRMMRNEDDMNYDDPDTDYDSSDMDPEPEEEPQICDPASCINDLGMYLMKASSSGDEDTRQEMLSVFVDAVEDISNLIASGADQEELSSSITRWKELAMQTKDGPTDVTPATPIDAPSDKEMAAAQTQDKVEA